MTTDVYKIGGRKLCGLKPWRPTKKRTLDTLRELEGSKPFRRVEVVFPTLINDSDIAVPSRVGVGEHPVDR
jgi:hypothetical protein